MKRRTFARVAGGAGVAVLGGGGFLFLRATKEVPLPAEGLLYFSPREYSIFTAVADAMIAVPKGVPDARELKVALKADQYMARHTRPEAQDDLHTLLKLFDNALAGFVFCGTIAPFSQMDIAARRAFLTKWENHRLPVLRTGFVALKKLAISCYYASPESWASLSYPGPMEAS